MNTDQNSTVELPQSDRYNASAKRSEPRASAVDYTIKIPDRLAAACIRVMIGSILLTFIVGLDIHTPYVRQYGQQAWDWTIERTSLDTLSFKDFHRFLVSEVDKALGFINK